MKWVGRKYVPKFMLKNVSEWSQDQFSLQTSSSNHRWRHLGFHCLLRLRNLGASAAGNTRLFGRAVVVLMAEQSFPPFTCVLQSQIQEPKSKISFSVEYQCCNGCLSYMTIFNQSESILSNSIRTNILKVVYGIQLHNRLFLYHLFT